MKPVAKGDLGEAAVTKELMMQGLETYRPVSNGSRIDLICMDNNCVMYKVQIKCTTSKKGGALLNLRKNTLNPKYNYHYREEDVDVFALYIEDRDICAFVSSEEIFRSKKKRAGMTFRVDATSRQTKGINMVGDYRQFPAKTLDQ